MTPMAAAHPSAPYPALPEPLAQRPEVRPWRLRPFGAQGEDLQVNLSADRPTAITEVLACCTLPAPDRNLLWDLPVGKRVECLLVLASLQGIESFDLDLRCPRCQGSFEVTLTIRELLDAGREAVRSAVDVPTPNGICRFRLPTGRDQLNWLGQSFADEASATRTVAATLALDDAGEAPLPALETALDEADPLLRAPVSSACPDCGHGVEGETDLAGMILVRLMESQEALIDEIDLLASRYHWSEAEILSMPAWRRIRYANRLRHVRP